MSATHHDGSYDSGHNHLRPALAAIALTALIALLTLALTGLPH